MGAEFLFMDDNARPHRANIVDECLQLEDITRMDWPAYSPDLNPIKHVWDMLDRRIAARQPLPPVYRNFGGSFVDPTPLAHADTSRDVLPRGGTSHLDVVLTRFGTHDLGLPPDTIPYSKGGSRLPQYMRLGVTYVYKLQVIVCASVLLCMQVQKLMARKMAASSASKPFPCETKQIQQLFSQELKISRCACPHTCCMDGRRKGLCACSSVRIPEAGCINFSCETRGEASRQFETFWTRR
ncbi:DDE_3 domain-containing protein [Trichonephila clavipes]|nr:DDE_3 domain-containing protein [Trichonephila clavipes]